MLAQRAGVELKTKFSPQRQERKEQLLAITHLACEFYHYLLTKHKTGERARQYLEGREIKQPSINEFKLGYAPNSWETTGKFLLSRGFKIDELLETGLIIQKSSIINHKLSNRPWYDRFRGRLMFPVFDVLGQVVGFSARTLINEEPKYINSPDSAIFKKGNLLYGLNLAKDEIRAKKQTILVEGNLDVISAHQNNFKNVVAPLGTGVTEAHTKLGKRFAQKIVFCFDNDQAGEQATLRGLAIAQSQDLEISVVQIRQTQDADELIRKDVNLFEKALNEAKSGFEYLLSLGKEKFGIDSASAKKKIAAALLPYLARTPDEIEKDALVKKLAEELEINEKSIWQDLERTIGLENKRINNQQSTINNQQLKTKKPRGILLAEHFLHLILISEKTVWLEEKFKQILNDIQGSFFGSDALTEIWQTIKRYFDKYGKINLKKIDTSLPKSAQKAFDLLILHPSDKIYNNDSDYLADLTVTAKELKKTYLRKKLQELSTQIRKAEKEGKDEEVEELKKEFKEILGEMPR